MILLVKKVTITRHRVLDINHRRNPYCARKPLQRGIVLGPGASRRIPVQHGGSQRLVDVSSVRQGLYSLRYLLGRIGRAGERREATRLPACRDNPQHCPVRVGLRNSGASRQEKNRAEPPHNSYNIPTNAPL